METVPSLGTRKWPQPFTSEELALFEGDEKYKETRTQLDELNTQLKRNKFAVERFVRVGCAALGTTLASRRLDRWLSVFGSIAKAMPDTPVADAFKDLADVAAAVIQERTNPGTLPSLEAMMPDSALIKLLNWPTRIVPGDLTVIAGDIEPDAWWAKLLIWATDRFYEGDHDLIVNTPSMYGGANREGTALVSFHKGPSVHHFSYFSSNASANQLVRALTRKQDDTAGFEPLVTSTVNTARAAIPRSADPQPVVFVLPGIMGSELTLNNNRIWADIRAPFSAV